MIIEGARVLSAEGRFEERDVCIEGGAFAREAAGERIDARGLYALPGLVDVHFHGCAGRDFCDADADAVSTIAAYEASRGVLAICPATMTYPEDVLAGIVGTAAAWREEWPHGGCADLVGINMEGPFISPARVGAQNPAFVQKCDAGMFRRLQEISGGLIRLVDVAPEEEGALEFIRGIKGEATVSLAHTCAGYEVAASAFSAGARQLTHLWNAMPPVHHREPGPIAAAAERDDVRVELICDGIHVHPSIIRLTFSLFAGRVVMISDSMEATGLDDGAYELGGQAVQVRGRRATLADGTIAGSATDLFDCLRFAVLEAGIDLAEAAMACTLTPARAIGVDDRYGSIEPGKVANLVLVDEGLGIRDIFLRGERLSHHAGS